MAVTRPESATCAGNSGQSVKCTERSPARPRETALAATVKDRNETICEAADLAYHLTVLLQDADLSWADVIGKLKERHAK